jgi:hypothetical protein
VTQPLLCVVCPVLYPNSDKPRQPDRPQVCDGCRTKLTEAISGIPVSLAAVWDSVEPGRTGAERRTVGYESRPPLNVSALSELHHGSVIPAKEGTRWPQDQLGTIPPRELLWWWAEDWAQERQESAPQSDAHSLCEWIINRLEWACDSHLAVDEFARDIRDATRALRAFRPSETGESAGRCPQRRGDTRCDAPLFVDPYVDTIRCGRCGTEWKRREGQWMHLRGQQMAAGVEAA